LVRLPLHSRHYRSPPSLSSVQEQLSPRSQRVLFVHAHPDDETIVTGGTIAKLVDLGAAVTVLTCTRGELGEVIPDEFKHLEGAGAELAQFRTGELHSAMHILGVTDHRFLGEASARWAGREPRRYLDSGMRWGEHGAVALESIGEETLCAADIDEVTSDIAAVIADAEIDVVVSYDATGGYGHPDHIRAHQAARRAAEAMDVPFYAIEPANAPHPAGFAIDVSAQWERKAAALRVYPSQVSVRGDRYALSSGPSLPIPSAERFVRLSATAAAASAWDDQGRSGKIAGSLLAFLTGVAVGALATVNHQAALSLWGAQLPVGVVASLVLVLALLAGLRLVFGTRLLPGLAAVGLLTSVGLLSLMSAGGSVLVPGNPVGWSWTFGAPIIALMVLGWPRPATAGASDGSLEKAAASEGNSPP
jgi:N-acetyl-1-D-myo-inositol-2-amino-2-deoxy-alpha-D-glucopyranoside deacetylase